LAGGLLWVLVIARRDSLLVVGDSLAAGAQDELVRVGDDAGYDVSVDAIAGTTLADRMPTIQEQASRRRGPLVIELGTNDAANGTSRTELAARIDEAIGYLTQVPCVVFVDVGLLVDGAEAAAGFNEYLHVVAAQHPNMHVYDWAAEFTQHPDWTPDGVHLQPAFYGQYAEGIIGAVKTGC
jgi:hypothetical protein